MNVFGPRQLGLKRRQSLRLQGKKKCALSLIQAVSIRSHLFCTWGAEGAAALQLPEMTISQTRAFLVEGVEGKVIESVKSVYTLAQIFGVALLMSKFFLKSTIGAG